MTHASWLDIEIGSRQAALFAIKSARSMAKLELDRGLARVQRRLETVASVVSFTVSRYQVLGARHDRSTQR